MRALALVSDAFGGRGGIAAYNRHLLESLCSYPGMEQVVVLPRSICYGLEEMPANLDYRASAAGPKWKYLASWLRLLVSGLRFDVVICGHLHLLTLAYLVAALNKCPVVPVIYGVEAWTPTRHRAVNLLCRRLRTFIAIRRLTARRFSEWAGLSQPKYHYLPNCVDPAKFGPGLPREDLVERYALRGRVVVMTAGRLDSVEFDRQKGFDEVIEVLPLLRQDVPNVTYLIMGDGPDKSRLVQKAAHLGVGDIIAFTGYVPEAEKADHYRLADVFAMPGSNPIFDRYPFRFVFLEALACGVPVVGCSLADQEEASDPLVRMIIQVDPDDTDQIRSGILRALAQPKGRVPQELRNFFSETFRSRLHHFISEVAGEGGPRREIAADTGAGQ